MTGDDIDGDPTAPQTETQDHASAPDFASGSPTVKFYSNTRLQVGMLVAGLLIVPASFGLVVWGILIMTRSDWTPGIFIGIFAIVIGLAFAAAGAQMLYQVFYPDRRTVELFNEGFVVDAPGRIYLAAPWENVGEIYQSSVKVTVNGISRTNHTLDVHLEDGTREVFGNPLQSVDHISDIFQELVAVHRGPDVRAQLAAGHGVDFGPFALSSLGLRAEPGILEWNDVVGLVLQQGTVIVKQDGRPQDWASAPLMSIPNYGLFKSLVDEMSGTS